jgi:flagellar motor switch protein FliM
MREVLTPDEVAALSAAFAADAPSAARAAPSVRAIDLVNQERTLEGRLPALELVLGRFARGLRGVLASALGDAPTVATSSIGLVRFARLVPRMSEPAGLVRFRMPPLRGQGMLAIPSSLVAALLQVSCGGQARQVTALPAREFSPIELRLVERVAARILAALQTAWEPLGSIECSLIRVETTPLFANVAAPDELVVHVELTVVVEGLEPCPITLVVPRASLDVIRARLQTVRAIDEAGTPSADAGWTGALRERALDVPLELTVELGTTELAVSRLLELAVGDLIELAVGRDGPVVVRVEGQPYVLGTPGVQGGHNAVRITERPAEENR